MLKTRHDNPKRLDLSSRVTQKALRVVSRASNLASPVDYNITASAEHKFLWFRVAKVGTRTIFARMNDQDVSFDLESPYRIRYSPKAYADYFKFAFVRNPWDRIVSCWHNKVIDSNNMRFSEEEHRKMQDFSRFVDWAADVGVHGRNAHIIAQSRLIDLNNCDYLGRMETFDEDLAHVFRAIGLENASRVSRNQTKSRKSYGEYYDSGLIEKVAEIYRKDIQLFGYEYSG